MILLTAGTVEFDFSRLMRIGKQLVQLNQVEKYVIQTGVAKYEGSKSHNLVVKDYFGVEEMIEYYKEARVIIAAAGEASVSLMMKYAKNIPILVPRRKKFGEQVDDQQVETAKYFVSRGLAVAADNIDEVVVAMNNLPNKQDERRLWVRDRDKERGKLIKHFQTICG